MIYIILAILLIYFIIIYNYQVNLLKKYERSKSNIDVYLQQRFELIPNLVNVVKAYTQYENQTLEKLTLLREAYNKSKKIKTAEKIEQQYKEILLRTENYPELKANSIFQQLSKNLVKSENQLQAARRAYNYDTMKYNLLTQTFPNNIISKILKWEEKDMFDADKDSEKNVKIDINN